MISTAVSRTLIEYVLLSTNIKLDAVNAVVMHRAGGILATSSGQRQLSSRVPDVGRASRVSPPNAGIAIWTVD